MTSSPAILNFFRREWLTRRAWLAALVVLNLLPLAFEAEVRAAAAVFGIACVLPLLAMGLAATHDIEADRYWASLGGRPLHRVLVRLAAHFGLLAVMGLLMVADLNRSAWIPAEEPLLLPLALTLVSLGVALVYVAAALARRCMSGGAALAGPLAAAGLLALGVVADQRLGSWSVAEGLGIRMGVLVAAGVVILARQEGRLPRRTEAHGLLVGAAGLAALITLVHAAWTGRPLLLTPTLVACSPDGATALYLPQTAGPLASRRALRWQVGEGFRQVGPAGVRQAELLPDGRVVLSVAGDGGSVWVVDETGMTRCPVQAAHADGACAVHTPAPAKAEVRPGYIEEGRVVDATTDASWPTAADYDDQGVSLVPLGDGVRAFLVEGPILELGPEGERSRQPLTLLEAVAG